MNFIDKLRIAAGRRYLAKEASRLKRSRRAVNLSDAREIGILFNMVSKTDYERVSQFAGQLQEQGKRVQIIGFYKYRKLPPYYAQTLAYDLIQPQHLDLIYRPKGLFVSHFINHSFDLLIDLGSGDEFPLQYIASLSKAGFKLGRKTEGRIQPYDLMIESGGDIESGELISQIVQYTSMFRFDN